MSIFDFISKPIKSVSPLNVLPKPDVSPLASQKPIVPLKTPEISQFIAKPVTEVLSGMKSGIDDAAQKTVDRKLPAPTTKTKVDWVDVANIIPTFVGQAVSPIVSAGLSLGKVAQDKLRSMVGKNAITEANLDEITIPAFGKDEVRESFGKEGSSYQKLDRGNFLDAQSSQKFMEDQIAAGVPEDKAFWNTVIKTGADMTALVTIGQGLTKSVVLKTAPETLVNPEVMTVSKEAIRDFITGRRTSIDLNIPQPLKEAITETLKTGSRADKIKMFEGIDVLQAKPSQLGKLLGISQEEADSILRSAYGGPVRQSPAGSLPGYVTDQPVVKMGLSTEKRTPVGFGPDEIPKELKPLAEEAKKYKSAEEFVKAQEEKSPLIGYHGTTPEKIRSIDKGGFFHMKDGTVYFATKKGVTSSYGSAVVTRDLSKLNLLDDFSPEAKIIREKAGVATDSYGFANEKVREIARQAGYDGLKTKTSKDNYDVMVFDNTKINQLHNDRVKELTDLYNKVVGEPDEIPKYKSAEEFDTSIRQKIDTVIKLAGNEIEDIKVIGSTADGKLKPNDTDILISLKNKRTPTDSSNIHHRKEFNEVIEKEIKDLFPNKVHVTIADFDPSRGKGISLVEFYNKVVEPEDIRYESTESLTKKAREIRMGDGTGPDGKRYFKPVPGESKESKLSTARKMMAQTEAKVGVQPVDIDQAYAEHAKSLSKEEEKVNQSVDNVLNVKKDKVHIDSLRMQNMISREMLLEDPARQLSKYANKRTGELPEVTGNPKSIFAQRGDDIVTELGFKDSEEARAAYEKYVQNRERVLKTRKNISEITQEYRDKKAVLEAVTKKLRAIGVGRKIRIDSIQEFFNLTDAEMAKVVKGNPDYRLLSEDQFQNLLKGIEGKAYDASLLSEARAKVEFTIFDKELVKVDNLRQAMKLPEIKNMTVAQLNKLDELLRTFKQGDEFLGVRQIETIKNTDLANIKTKREALEDLAKRAGVPYLEMGNIKTGKFDRYLYDVALARQSPFHKIMVEDTSRALANANVRLYEFKRDFNDLMVRARKSRSRSLLNKAIPTDDMVFDWLDSDAGTKLELAKRMTAEELDVARFVYNKYAEVRDYLINKGQLDKYRTNYITHVQRGFLEALKESIKPKYVNGRKISTGNILRRTTRGVLEGLKEMLAEYKEQEAYFNIMNQKTGEVLPLEKFFKFSLRRTDQLVPTKNVAKAVLQYMSAFEKKVALDSIVPKIDVYAHAITPNGLTPRGLELDDSLKRFVKEWLNTKRGRVADTLIVTPGGPVDWAVRSLIGFTRLLDLGVNVPVGLASNVGEQVMTAINIGFKKTALGATRALTPQGKKIAEKYAGFVGERMIDKIRDTSKNLGDKFSETVFGLFSAASRRANIEHLLGSMTNEEFAKGEISAERLGKLRLEIGKYRVIEQGESVIGKTALGKAFTQYKSWAVGSLHSSLSNLNTLQKMLREKKNPIHSREFQELLRATMMSAFIALSTYGIYSHLRDKKDRTFLEQLAFKSMNDAFSLLGALDPSLWTTLPRTASFLNDLGTSLSNIAVSLVTGERTKKDHEIKGLSKFLSTLTPSLVRTAKTIDFDSFMPSSNPKLKGIKLTPRANTSISLTKTSPLKGIKLVPKKSNIKIK